MNPFLNDFLPARGMKESKLIQLLNTLAGDEWKEFEKYIISPYFNGNKKYLPILKYFRSQKSKGVPLNSSPEKIYKKLYPGKPFNKNVMNTMLSGFTKMLEGYLVQYDYDMPGYNKKIAYLRQIEWRNSVPLFRNEIKGFLKEMNSIPFGTVLMDHIKEVIRLRIQEKRKSNYIRKVEADYIQKQDIQFFSNYINALSDERNLRLVRSLVNKEHPESFHSRWLNTINTEELFEYMDENYPEIADKLKVLIALHTSKNYRKNKELLYKHIKLFARSEQTSLILLLEALLIELINDGKRELVSERHLLHRFMLENEMHIYYTKAKIQTRLTENIISTALWCKEFRWLENFVKTYSSSFADEMKESLLLYAEACLLFHKKQYPEAMKTIRLVKNLPYYTRFVLKNLELEMLYEMKEFPRLHYAIDSYLKFKENKSISAVFKKSMDQNISAFKILVELAEGRKKGDLKKLREKLRTATPSQFNDWMLEKIAEL